MLISHTPVRGVILKYFGENHTLCVKFEPNWTRCKQLEEGIKSLACGSWFYPFLSLFANSFNLERYSSRGGQEKPLGWRLGGFLDHHSMNILINTPRSNKILPRVLPKYSRLRLEYFGRTLGSILLLLGVFISNSTIVWFSLKYFRQSFSWGRDEKVCPRDAGALVDLVMLSWFISRDWPTKTVRSSGVVRLTAEWVTIRDGP